MFTWICPQCGAEVPPSYDECPKCADKAKAAPAAVAPPVAAPPQPQPVAAPPAPQAPPPHPQYTPLPQYAPPQPAAAPQYPYAMPAKQGPPAWLVTLGVAAAFVIGGYGLYSFLGSRGKTAPANAVIVSEQKPDDTSSGKAVPFDKPAAGKAETKAESKPSPTSPLSADQLAKHLEAVGIRFTEENRRTVVTVAIVNHSGAEMSDLRGKIRIVTKDGEKSVSTVDFKMAAIGPYEVRDYTIPLLTTMRAYELPDWQFLKAEIELR